MTDEQVFKTPNGISIHTPGGLPKIEQWQEKGNLVERYEYANGWILIIEWHGKQAHIDTNISLTNYQDGSMGPIPGLPKNPDFVDRHKP